ncbi:MAG: aldehyde dehydrogenase EutE [Eubacteriales bacterium]|nr:aldehyde dehydrogenase EutE [Eubacteriales bacterium]
MKLTTVDIEKIVRQVIADLSETSPLASQVQYKKEQGEDGVFEKMQDAIEAAKDAQKEFSRYTLEDRKRLIDAIRTVCSQNAEDLARRVWQETRMGRYEDKIQKHRVVIEKTPGTECLTTDAISGDTGLMLEEYGPYGVIGAITPTTNPTETIINNTISMIAGGNSVVYNVHPAAKRVCAYCLQLIHRTIVNNGGPKNLITMVKEPTMETVKVMTESPHIRLMVGTGGMPMVNALLRSGKKTIGAGAGNPPVVIDETADLELAAKEIYHGASFDNNLLCLAEKEVFVVKDVLNPFLSLMQEQGAYLLSDEQTARLLNIVYKQENGKYEVNKQWVGQDAGKMLRELGITNDKIRLLLCKTNHDHPFVMVEQLMPILPVVGCDNFEQAVEWAIKAENGNRHTASMFSKNVDHMTYFAKRIETTVFVKNGSTLRGVGIGGEGYTTMTIAGPTGEGLTCAKSFTRRRRCQLADGGLRIV